MYDIVHRIGIKARVESVYEALATVKGIAGWWTEETTGESSVGGSVEVVFRSEGAEKGRMTFQLLELDPDEEIRWRFTSGPDEWVGTDVTFALRQEGEYAIVVFGHRNWREPVEFMAHCSMKWGTFLLSLREFVETGTGRPSPRDLKIDNWN
jgi:uncharacterized protein YndB with AHSA1/START domain